MSDRCSDKGTQDGMGVGRSGEQGKSGHCRKVQGKRDLVDELRQKNCM